MASSLQKKKTVKGKAQRLSLNPGTAAVTKSAFSSSVGSVAATPSGVMRGLVGNVSYKIRLTVTTELLASAIGTIQFFVRLDPSFYDNWTQCSGLFDEVRVLGGRCFYRPYNRYNRLTTSTAPCVMAFDNDNNGPTSATSDVLWQFGTAKVFSVDDPLEYAFVRPHITPSAYWSDVTAPASNGTVQAAGENLSFSVAYGRIYTEIECEFRSTR